MIQDIKGDTWSSDYSSNGVPLGLRFRGSGSRAYGVKGSGLRLGGWA